MYEVYPSRSEVIKSTDLGDLLREAFKDVERFQVAVLYRVFKDNLPTGYGFRRWGMYLVLEKENERVH